MLQHRTFCCRHPFDFIHPCPADIKIFPLNIPKRMYSSKSPATAKEVKTGYGHYPNAVQNPRPPSVDSTVKVGEESWTGQMKYAGFDNYFSMKEPHLRLLFSVSNLTNKNESVKTSS